MLCLPFSVCGWVDNFVNDNCSSFFWQEVGHCPHCAVLPPSLMCVLGSPTTAHSLWISAQIEHQCNHAYFSNHAFLCSPGQKLLTMRYTNQGLFTLFTQFFLAQQCLSGQTKHN